MNDGKELLEQIEKKCAFEPSFDKIGVYPFKKYVAIKVEVKDNGTQKHD